jgi:hypothetical protein
MCEMFLHLLKSDFLNLRFNAFLKSFFNCREKCKSILIANLTKQLRGISNVNLVSEFGLELCKGAL